MKHLVLAIAIIISLGSCASSAKSHAKRKGLVAHGCRGINALPRR